MRYCLLQILTRVATTQLAIQLARQYMCSAVSVWRNTAVLPTGVRQSRIVLQGSALQYLPAYWLIVNGCVLQPSILWTWQSKDRLVIGGGTAAILSVSIVPGQRTWADIRSILKHFSCFCWTALTALTNILPGAKTYSSHLFQRCTSPKRMYHSRNWFLPSLWNSGN